MMKIVDFLWIVPSTDVLSIGTLSVNLEDDFTFLDLAQNFRNSREVVKMTKSYAEEKDYAYKKGIVMPPENFPSGCTPIFVDSIEDAMKEARKRTKDGILVITDILSVIDGNHSNRMKENCKVYRELQNDFKPNENPYKFLQEGNVLIVDGPLTYGFEWTTVIVIERHHQLDGAPSYHDCNRMMRCTTNLIVVKKK